MSGPHLNLLVVYSPDIERAKAFYPAETYHQDFAFKNPNHGYIRAWDAPKVAALKRLYPRLYSANFQRN